MADVTITESLGTEVAASVSLTSLTRIDTGLPVPNVTLPKAFTDQGGGTAWQVTFQDFNTPPPWYDYTWRINWPDGSYSDVTGRLTPLASATSFWTSQSNVEQIYGVDNCEQDVNLNDNGAGTDAVWQQALDNTDARIDLLIATYGKARPTDLTSGAYRFASRVASAQVRNDLHKGRGQTEGTAGGGPNVGGVYAKEAADLWDELVGYLEEQVIDFPDVTDTAGEIVGTAPQLLRPTVDSEGLPLQPVGSSGQPHWDPNVGYWHW